MPFTHAAAHSPDLKQPDADRLYNLLSTYGSQSLSYSATQPNLRYFGDPETGIIPFTKRWGVTLSLGNPLCSPEYTETLCRHFLQEHPNALFAQVEGHTAHTLKALGLYVTPAGMDCHIDLSSFNLQGKTKRDLRHYRNRASAGSVVVEEAIDTSALRESLVGISSAWIARKRVHRRELAFLVRPFHTYPERDTRLFVARIGSATAGFVIFDPMYDHGIVTGCTAVIARVLPDAPEGTLDTIVMEAATQFRAEGKSSLSLGVAPLYRMKEAAALMGKGALPLYHACRILYRMSWQPILNVRGLSFHKSRYRPQERPVYLATTSPLGIPQMIALLRTCRIL